MLKTAATAELTATAAHEIFMAGYGGQGVMLAGEILARAALDEGREIAFTRSYGPQMRGGTANCSVVIAGGPIDFPVAESPTAAVFFNAPSLPAFQSLLRPGALMIVNTSLIDDFAGRDDLVTLGLPLNDLAREIGSDRVLNIIALGALIETTGVVSDAAIVKVLRRKFDGARSRLLPLNEQALSVGRQAARGSDIKGCR